MKKPMAKRKEVFVFPPTLFKTLKIDRDNNA
jgi:hypothetical protein